MRAFVGGSIVTARTVPGDFDGCWDPIGVDPFLIDPVLLDFSNGRIAQKLKYGGELFISSCTEADSGRCFLDFFQEDKSTGKRIGVIELDLRSLP